MRWVACLILLSAINVSLADERLIAKSQESCLKSAAVATQKRLDGGDLILKALNGGLRWEKIRALYGAGEFRRQTVKSPHDVTKTHAIAALSAGGDYLAYYVGEGNAFPLCVSLASGRVRLLDWLYVGQRYEVFRNKFSLDKKVDMLVLETLEGGNILNLYFKREKLVRIVYLAAYVD